jgi:hypothetical protein
MSLTPIRITPTTAFIDAALHNDRIRLKRYGYTIDPAKFIPAEDCYGDRIKVRITQGSWSAVITAEDISGAADGAPDWYADAKVCSMTAAGATLETLSDDIEALTLTRDVLRTVCIAIGQSVV